MSVNLSHPSRVVHLQTSQLLKCRIEAISATPDEQHIIAMTDTGIIFSLDTKTLEIEWEKTTPRGNGLCVSKALNVVYLGVSTGGHQLIDLASGEVVSEKAGSHNTDFILQGCFGGAEDDFLLRPEDGEQKELYSPATCSANLFL